MEGSAEAMFGMSESDFSPSFSGRRPLLQAVCWLWQASMIMDSKMYDSYLFSHEGIGAAAAAQIEGLARMQAQVSPEDRQRYLEAQEAFMDKAEAGLRNEIMRDEVYRRRVEQERASMPSLEDMKQYCAQVAEARDYDGNRMPPLSDRQVRGNWIAATVFFGIGGAVLFWRLLLS